MPTKVFISWGGELSRKLGEALRLWLPASLQYVKPYFSPEDVEKGTKWNAEIAKELEATNVGIICLTQDNTERPWILFEAGALSKRLDESRVCTLLFDLEPTDVKGPLASIQTTRFVESDFRRLVVTINNVAGDAKLESSVLDSVFKKWWPELKAQIDDILRSHDKGGEPKRRSDRDILEEVLALTRMNASRGSKGPRLSERALVEFLETLDEMMFMYGRHGPDDMAFHLIRRLDRPLRHLCMEAGIPDVYERHAMHMHEMRRMIVPSEIKGEESEEDACDRRSDSAHK